METYTNTIQAVAIVDGAYKSCGKERGFFNNPAVDMLLHCKQYLLKQADAAMRGE